MLRKLYDAVVFVSRPIRSLLASVRRLPVWCQVALFVISLIVAILLAGTAYYHVYRLFRCPPNEPDCGPWSTE
jgi:hypothetical protein